MSNSWSRRNVVVGRKRKLQELYGATVAWTDSENAYRDKSSQLHINLNKDAFLDANDILK